MQRMSKKLPYDRKDAKMTEKKEHNWKGRRTRGEEEGAFSMSKREREREGEGKRGEVRRRRDEK